MIILIGCFGNSAEDRFRENELDNYLNSQDSDCDCDILELDTDERPFILSIDGSYYTQEDINDLEDDYCPACGAPLDLDGYKTIE